ncbi:MAG: paraquat-inducible protein A [Bacteroidota bacterium]
MASEQSPSSKKVALILAFSIITVCLSGFFCCELISDNKTRQELKYDLAIINDIQFGLFDTDNWKQQITRILHKKIDEFEFTYENRLIVKAEVEKLLIQLIDEVEVIIKKETTSGLLGFVKGFFAEILLDLDKLKEKVPDFADQVIAELDKPATKARLKQVLKDKIEEIFESKFKEVDKSSLIQLLNDYGFPSAELCNNYLENEIRKIDKSIKVKAWIICLMAFITLALLFFVNRQSKLKYSLLVIICLVLLAGGLLVPMIEIDARIQSLSFTVMGEKMTFENQLLYYQSKSITQVVQLLTRTGKVDLVFVGVLLLAFSIVFPLLKLLCCFCLPWYHRKLTNASWSRVLLYYSAKWSFVDVLVVAMFLAYIGFRGLVNNQFSSLEMALAQTEIFTTNHTGLLTGFLLFTAFCVTNMILSIVAQRDYPESREKLFSSINRKLEK